MQIMKSAVSLVINNNRILISNKVLLKAIIYIICLQYRKAEKKAQRKRRGIKIT